MKSPLAMNPQGTNQYDVAQETLRLGKELGLPAPYAVEGSRNESAPDLGLMAQWVALREHAKANLRRKARKSS